MTGTISNAGGDVYPAFDWHGARWQTAPPVTYPERAKLGGYVPPQARMKARAAELGYRCEIQAQVPTRNGGSYRAYGSFPTWQDALAAVERVPPEDRHFFKLIPEGRPVKPYLDIDCKVLPVGFVDSTMLAARVQEVRGWDQRKTCSAVKMCLFISGTTFLKLS
jgi:hypothetical protein